MTGLDPAIHDQLSACWLKIIMKEALRGEITFDTEVAEEGQEHIEGCYRLQNEDWKVFYFTNWVKGNRWKGEPDITKDGIWQSGITGVEVWYPANRMLNKDTVKRILSEVLNVPDWVEVRGPDSLKLK